jgi:methylamine dehydrogenase accessory protein MauD
MNTVLVVAIVALWGVVLLLGFLLLGALRALGLLNWRLEQLEATTPHHIGRRGLKRGTRAPDFTLMSTAGKEMSLHEFAGRQVLLVFVQTGCDSCQGIATELNRLQRQGDLQVVVVNNGELEDARRWADEVGASFPVLVQNDWGLGRRYEIFSAPFAFLIDAQGNVASKGIINQRRHVGFVLSGAGERAANEPTNSELTAAETGESGDPFPKPKGGVA